jgi:hypothetical protein
MRRKWDSQIQGLEDPNGGLALKVFGQERNRGREGGKRGGGVGIQSKSSQDNGRLLPSLTHQGGSKFPRPNKAYLEIQIVCFCLLFLFATLTVVANIYECLPYPRLHSKLYTIYEILLLLFPFKKTDQGQARWLSPVIPATSEADIRRFVVQGWVR